AVSQGFFWSHVLSGHGTSFPIQRSGSSATCALQFWAFAFRLLRRHIGPHPLTRGLVRCELVCPNKLRRHDEAVGLLGEGVARDKREVLAVLREFYHVFVCVRNLDFGYAVAVLGRCRIDAHGVAVLEILDAVELLVSLVV